MSKIRVNDIIPANGLNIGIGTTNGSVSFNADITGGMNVTTGLVGVGTDNPDHHLHLYTGTLGIGKSENTGYEILIDNNNLSFSRDSKSYINQKGTGTISVRLGPSYTEVAEFTSDGLKFPSGNGIDFSADGNAAGNQSEVLNDYEEGYATATMTCGTSGTITLSNDEVSYVKVGDLVNIHGRLDVSSVSSPTGELIVNLPFNAANVGNGAYASHSAVSLFIWSANSGAGYSETGLWVGWISPDDNKMRIRYGSTATPAASGAGGMQAGTEVRFTATFRTV